MKLGFPAVGMLNIKYDPGLVWQDFGTILWMLLPYLVNIYILV